MESNFFSDPGINPKIAVIGLGYVGLPLAVEFSKKFNVIGYDIQTQRIVELQNYLDKTLELSETQLKKAKNIIYTSQTSDLRSCDFFIVTVPTPIDKNKRPNLKHLIEASELVGDLIKNDSIVVYESTVYPGVTEEICVPILEKRSGLKYNENFFCGYSPERINPGDKEHDVTKIKKVTSGSNDEVATYIDKVYREVITAGTFKAKNIKVAEAAKVIENTQRDLNIALINELSMIFSIMDIDTEAVLDAASTKWNFQRFSPGLVGGHCIGVDPYYLTFKAQEIGHHPEVILSGRKINDSMGSYVASQLVKSLIKKDITINNSLILIMGFTFKENCPDTRNTKVLDVIDELKSYGCKVDVYDPYLEKVKEKDQDVNFVKYSGERKYDAIIIAVAHKEFIDLGIKRIKLQAKENSIVFDLKSVFEASQTDLRL